MTLPRAAMPALAALAALALPAVLAAQEPPDSLARDTTLFRIEGIEARAARALSTAGGASAFQVDLAALRVPPSPTTEAVLREIPALHLRTNSRGQAEISVRGSGSRQVAVLVDGVPLTLGWDARTDVSVLPAGAVKNISFVRGLSTMLHGPNVLGGVVEMSVTQGIELPRTTSLSAAASVDHEGGYSTSATGETPFETGGGAGVVRFGVGWMDDPGFPLPGEVDEPVPTPDGLRLNTDAENLNGFLALRYEDDAAGWATLSASSFRAERGIGAELGAEEPRLWRYPDIRRTIVALSGGTGHHDTPWGRGDLEASVGLDTGGEEILAYATRDYDDVVGTEIGDDRTVTLRLLGDHTLGARGDLAASYTFSTIDREQAVDGETREYRQRLMSLGGETTWRLLDGAGGRVETVRLSVGGAWDRAWTPRSGGLPSLGSLDDWGGRVGLSALVNEGSTMLHAGVSRRGRFPALREMYSEALNRFVPNPDLRPEHLVAFEAGVTTRLGQGEVQVVGFRHDLSGAIRRITLEDGRRKRVNSDELRSEGVEVLLNQSVGEVSFGGDLTLQSVELTDPSTAASTEPENLPEQTGRAWVTAPLVGGATGTLEAEYTGAQFCQDPDTGQDVELDGGTWLNATLSRIWPLGDGSRRLETTVSGDNLADTALYDQCGLPRSGRLLRVQVRVF